MPIGNDYLKKLRERAHESRAYRKYQLEGLEIADLLNDRRHKSLYIKLVKEGDPAKLRRLARSIAENAKVVNKGAYFMACLAQERAARTRKNGR